MRGGAKFSEDQHYRYVLSRSWGDGFKLTWVMLNPSTADASKNDPTIRRVINYTKAWGYDGLYVVNLFAKRSPDPKTLAAWPDPIGPDNDHWILWAAKQAPTNIMVAWGANGRKWPDRVKWVLQLLSHRAPLKCLAVTRSGHPAHPLMLSSDLQPLTYNPHLRSV